MVIPEIIIKSVAFICYKTGNGIHFAGTCFFMGIPYKTNINGEKEFFPYVITAKHVIINIKAHSTDGKVLLRLNLKDGKPKYYESSVDDWFSNPDEPTDVSILVWSPPKQDNADITHLMDDMFQNDNVEQIEKVRAGDDVATIGLFVKQSGKTKNTPIVRAGNLALVADKNEKISTSLFGDIEAHLIESRSIGGLSGSPVFVHMTGPRINDNGDALHVQMRYIYLLGLIHGHYDIQLPKEDQAIDDFLSNEAVNMGIAIVIPASKIKEVLYHPIIANPRNEYIRINMN